MSKKSLLIVLLSCFFSSLSCAADLSEVFKQAQLSDPIFQQAMSAQLANKENLPISIATLLPQVNLFANPNVTRTVMGGIVVSPPPNPGSVLSQNNIQRAYTMSLNVTQTVFSFGQFSTVAGAYAISKQADAVVNAALQDLMIRTARAYFNVLQAEDNLTYSEASKRAFKEQLEQIRQQYRVGLKTLTDVYTAEASYDSAVASVIQAKTQVINFREDLRVITGIYYPQLAKLGARFPMLKPEPANVDTWVDVAHRQNWSIRAQQFSVEYFRQQVRVQTSGHLPTVSAEASLNRFYTFQVKGPLAAVRPQITTNRQLGLVINVPIFAGGGVIAQTNQAIYNYQNSQQKLDQTIRDTLKLTRQSYNNILSGISQIKADQQTVKSTISSLHGMEASYQIGTETLYDVLNQQQRVFQAQLQYAKDRYSFVNNLLALKQAAGTLSCQDLAAVNTWLIDGK